MMGIYAVVGEKGGTGKSVLTTNLAAMRAQAGHDVLLVDTDTQASSSGWQAVRSENSNLARVSCVQKFGKTVAAEVRELAARFEDTFVDAGGRDSVEMRASLLVADLVILPFQASQFDLWTVAKMHQLLSDASQFNERLRALAVVNQAETHASNTDYLDAKALLAEYPGITLLEQPIRKRVVFKRAAMQGMSVAEYDTDKNSKAIQEISHLYNTIFPTA